MMIVGIDGRMREGVGTLVRNVALRIASRVQQVIVLGDPGEIRKWGALPDNLEVVPFLAPIYGWREQVNFPISRLQACSIVHIPHFNIPIWPLPCPLVVSIHDTAHLAGVLPMSWPYTVAARLYYAYASWKAKHLITGSEFSKQEIISRLRVKPEDITVIPDGVDASRFVRRTPEIIEAVLGRLGIKKPYLLVLGSVRPHKNVAMALRAFEQLKIKLGIPHSLVIVGRREGFRINQSLPQMAERVEQDLHFTGFLSEEDIIALYSGAEIFLFPSLYEGFGLPPLEAMACGTPVAVSRLAAVPEVVGEAGAYFDPYSLDDVVQTVYTLLNDPARRAQLSRAGRQRAELFDWERTTEGHLEVYNKFSK